MVKITVLNDNRCNNKRLECEHGLSLFIDNNDEKILFDAGQTDIFLKNASKLGVDLDDIDSIVLSHGDYDHGNGLKYFNKKVKLICHPNFTKNRISKRTGKFDGLNESLEEIKSKFILITTKKPYNISDNITYLGEIEKTTDFEKGKNLPMIDENGEVYSHLDDSGIAIKLHNSIIVISGCAHSGICNTVEYAKKITKCNNVLAVMGGFHLKEIDEQAKKTIKYMKDNNIKHILVAHCTSDTVCTEFKKELPNETEIVETGKTYVF